MKPKYEIIQFYSDTLVGTVGEQVKEWIDPNGNHWVRLYFGKNLSGQRLVKSFPSDVLKKVE